MPTYSLARLAESDLKSVIRYTVKTWGISQAKRYTLGLRECFQLLAENPTLGRRCDSIHKGLRRFEHGKHVVFYVDLPEGILIARVLHQKMVPTGDRFRL